MVPEKRSRRSACILLLETDDAVRAIYDTRLRAAGYDVVSVAASDAAIAAVAQRLPMMIIANFEHRTREDRFNLCERLKADPRRRPIPVLLASTHMDDGDLRRATDAGVLAATVSPSGLEKLVGAVTGILSIDRPRRRQTDGVSAA